MPCLVLAGQVSLGRQEAAAAGVEAAYSVAEQAGSVEAAMARPADRLRELAARRGPAVEPQVGRCDRVDTAGRGGTAAGSRTYDGEDRRAGDCWPR